MPYNTSTKGTAFANSSGTNYGAVTIASADVAGGDSCSSSSWSKQTPLGVPSDDPSHPQFRDISFAAIFLLHLACMAYLAVGYGSWSDAGGEPSEEADLEPMAVIAYTAFYKLLVVRVIIPSVAFSIVLMQVSSFLMLKFSDCAVRFGLSLSIGSTVLIAAALIASYPAWYSIVIGIAIILVTIWYVIITWKLVPFAASNLEAALMGVSANCAIHVVALLFAALAILWVVLWSYIANGVLTRERSASIPVCQADDCTETYIEDEKDSILWGSLFVLLVSLYWTCSVLMNTIQVTVAGTVGTWCFVKDEGSCISAGTVVFGSLYRSLTFSFGSICFGSLVEAVVRALKVLAEIARSERNRHDSGGGQGNIVVAGLLCIAHCVLSLIEDIIDYINKWAYVFVGVYGSSYLDGGHKVMELFRARGWTTIITNDLAGYILNFTALIVAILSGMFSAAINLHSHDSEFDMLENPNWLIFGIGFISGLFVSIVATNVIKSAVNTVIVCFADAPGTLEENHPDVTLKMSTSWTKVFPECGIKMAHAYSVEV